MDPIAPIVICADIGSFARGNFGWWSSLGDSGTAPSSLAKYVADALNSGKCVALGFECPLFVPLAEDERNLTNGRPGEGDRPWSAGAGCGALATGLVQVAWILQSVRRALIQPVPAFIAWAPFAQANSGLFLWEAFVSGKAKHGGHMADAQAGAQAFLRAGPNPESVNAVVCQSGVYSLIGAALLRTGWSSDPRILHEACLVVRGSEDTV